MAWDLGIAANGDIVVSGNRDLAGISGSDLLEQRMKIRLRLHRGEWTYDDSNVLGSTLYTLTGVAPAQAAAMAPAYVREALRPMADEIDVDDVQISSSTHAIIISVFYHIAGSMPVTASDVQQLDISVPLSGG